MRISAERCKRILFLILEDYNFEWDYTDGDYQMYFIFETKRKALSFYKDMEVTKVTRLLQISTDEEEQEKKVYLELRSN